MQTEPNISPAAVRAIQRAEAIATELIRQPSTAEFGHDLKQTMKELRIALPRAPRIAQDGKREAMRLRPTFIRTW